MNKIIGIIATLALVLGVVGAIKTNKVIVGENGQQGVQGLRGERGIAGQQGLKGDKGDRGLQGASGAIGMPAKLGAISGPDINSPYLSVNGFETDFYKAGLNRASSTICAFKTPAATSTLEIGSLKVSSGLTGALFFEIGKSTVMDATTTSLGTYAAGSGTQFTMIASTTAVDNVDDNRMFAPSNWLVFKTSSTTPAQITGSCVAKFIVN